MDDFQECSRCRQILPHSAFYPDRARKYPSLRIYCITCDHEYGKEYRAAHPEIEAARHARTAARLAREKAGL